MKQFTIKYLADREFEALARINPRYAKTKGDLGFADMVTNRIFVRNTGIKPLDMFVTNHEIEEILAKNSEHEDEFKIRHKKGKDIFIKYVAPVFAGLLTCGLGTAAGLGINMARAVGAAAGGLTGGINKYQEDPKSAPLGALSGALGGFAGANMGAGFANPGTTATIGGSGAGSGGN